MKMLASINIKAKLIIFLSIMLLSVCGSLAFVFAYYTVELFEDDLKKRGLAEASNLATESKFGTLTEDSEILMPLLAKKLNNPDILFIEVINKDQNIIASAYRYQPASDLTQGSTPPRGVTENPSLTRTSSAFYLNATPTRFNYFKITTPVYSTPLAQNKYDNAIDAIMEMQFNPEFFATTVSKKTIGEIRIGISLTRLEAKTQAVLKFISLITFAILLLAILIGYALARSALTPLLTMSTIATQIAGSDLKNVRFNSRSMALSTAADSQPVTLAPTSRDEIGLLAEAFIKMSSRLQDYGLNLEREAQERTEELLRALQQSRELKSAAESANNQLLTLNNQLQLFQRCIEETSDFVLITDQQGRIHTCNQSFLEQNGYTAKQVKHHTLRSFFADSETERFDTLIWPTVVEDQGEWQGQTRFCKSSGLTYPIDLSITSVRDHQQELIAYICISRDITQQLQHQQELMKLASRDPLTGLFNRRRFLEELDLEIDRCQRRPSELALLWLDLDQFKEINDSMGHQAGDELLIKLAQNLDDLTRDADIIARLGGDEFAILLRDTSPDNARISAERLLNGIRSNLISINKQPVRIMTSIGIALFPAHSTNSHGLLACADIALYKSKHAGRNQFNFFHPDDREHGKYSHHQAWTQRLWDTLDENRLTLYRQPIVNVDDGQAMHYELLLRMHDEQGETVMPRSFITLAERTGMIHEIDRWVIAHAVSQYKQSELQKKGCKVTINLSAKALSDESFPSYIEQQLSAVDTNPRMFIFEITENSAIADLNKATRFINRLKQTGCEFALDDFGVGFASFSHLKNLDISYLKIDGSFIREITHQPRDRGIVEAMIKVAQSLNIKTIAEWVENADTMALLAEMGIDYVQGYHLGKPEPLINPVKPKT